MKIFKVGDRVRVTRDICGWPTSGLMGSISEFDGYGFTVKTDVPFPTSLLFGSERNWVWCYAKNIERIAPEKPKHPVIVITSDGKTTTATKRLGKKVICTATARCSDDDTFDFNTGAELAFQRLREKEKPVPKEPKILNGRVVCVESHCGWWTQGKIYTAKDGVVPDDDGYYHDGFRSIGELNDYASATFIPLLED